MRSHRLYETPGPLTAALTSAIEKAARSDLPVLLEGETGTGKTHIAPLIHRQGKRAKASFIAQNCGALAPSLIEAELFGRERGAYTDAKESAPGLVEQAHGGTLFLDEIAELRPPEQAKLLTVLEESSIRRVGGRKQIDVDVRFIAATNRDLLAAVKRGDFREDLYYRCRGILIRIPPLREREDFDSLLSFVLAGLGGSIAGPGTTGPKLDDAAMAALRSYAWPGNFRELLYVLEEASLNSENGLITMEHLPACVLERDAGLAMSSTATKNTRDNTRHRPDEERRMIVATLQQAGGNRTHAARLLGMSRTWLWERMHRYRVYDDEWWEFSE